MLSPDRVKERIGQIKHANSIGAELLTFDGEDPR
jgi:hypothetical protein